MSVIEVIISTSCSTAGQAETGSEFSNTSGLIAVDNVQCGTGDDRLLECYSSPLLSYNCTQNDLAGVTCEGEVAGREAILSIHSIQSFACLLDMFLSWNSSTAPCQEGEVRLVGANVSNEGRVEVCLGNTWATVCDNGWANNDASVVCGQLGYPTQGADSRRP